MFGTPDWHSVGVRCCPTFDMRGFTCFLPKGTVALGWQHLRIGLPEITIAYRAFAIVRRERFPQLATRFGGTITKGQTNNPARLAFQGSPKSRPAGLWSRQMTTAHRVQGLRAQRGGE